MSPAKNGPLLSSVLVTCTSAEAVAVPPLSTSSVLFESLGSDSSASTVTTLSNAPAASIVAVTVMLTLVIGFMLAILHGREAQAPLTPVMVRLVGVSTTLTLVAGCGPPLVTTSV